MEETKSVNSIGSFNERVKYLISLHFHSVWGSPYWLKRQEQLGWNVQDRIRCLEDLWLLGPMPLDDLRRFSVNAFIPKSFDKQLHRFIVGETAGTSGKPCVTAYRDDEFQTAFITPFLKVAKVTGFPTGKQWLWVGPSGPHIIGKVVRELAKQTDSMDPFSVDFDPRWAKRLAEGSTARQRYLDHVINQVLDVLDREEISVLFITPPTLSALLLRLKDSQREKIKGIHYGGTSLSPEMVNNFRNAFPEAVHLAGYGNTLFGVAMEVVDVHRTAMDYYPIGDRLIFNVVKHSEEILPIMDWPPKCLNPGQIGRVMFHRLDESCLLLGILERDQAEIISPNDSAISMGGNLNGVRNPQTPISLNGRIQVGLY